MPSGVKHEPTDETRETVVQMARAGITRPSIARVLGISDETLRKHYAVELETATPNAIRAVAQSLYDKAMSNHPQAITAAIFYLKTQGQWRTSDETRIAGPDGEAIAPQVVYIKAAGADSDA